MKKHPTILTAEAERDLFAIVACIADNNPAAAGRFYETFTEACDLLATMPEMGVGVRDTWILRTQSLTPVRVWYMTAFSGIAVFYRSDDQRRIHVLRVLSTRRDLPLLFATEK